MLELHNDMDDMELGVTRLVAMTQGGMVRKLLQEAIAYDDTGDVYITDNGIKMLRPVCSLMDTYASVMPKNSVQSWKALLEDTDSSLSMEAAVFLMTMIRLVGRSISVVVGEYVEFEPGVESKYSVSDKIAEEVRETFANCPLPDDMFDAFVSDLEHTTREMMELANDVIAEYADGSEEEEELN